MVSQTINLQRMHQQALIDSTFTSAEAVVSYLGAVQAQDYYGVKWSLAMRMQSATDDAIEAALDEGRILRTHMMRPTWHLVMPEDIRWIMRLTAHRVHSINTYQKRQVELDDNLLAQTNDIIASALEGGQHLTRNEIGTKLAEVGIIADGVRLAYIMFHAELELVACSGARRGKQFTYALLDERAPKGHDYEGDEAFAELTRRYFQAHAPATEQDFSWWSGLTLTEARHGMDLIASELVHIHADDETYYFLEANPPKSEASTKAILIPTFDELYVGYTGFGERVSEGQTLPKNMLAAPPIVIDGRIVGTWRRTIKKKDVLVDVALFGKPSTAQEAAIQDAVEQYGAFLGLTATAHVSVYQ